MIIETNNGSTLIIPSNRSAFCADDILASEVSYRDPFNARRDRIPADKVTAVLALREAMLAE